MNPLNCDAKVYSRLLEIEEPLTEAEEACLHDLVQKRCDESSTIIELNPYQGRVTATLALSCHGLPHQVYCFDRWPHIYQQLWLDHMEAAGVGNVVLPLRGEPLDTLRVMGVNLASKQVNLVVHHVRHNLAEQLALFVTALSYLQPGDYIVARRTKDSEEHFVTFWSIVSKVIHSHEPVGQFYYGVKP